MDFQQNDNIIPMASVSCGRPGRIYPDPETQCQVKYFSYFHMFLKILIGY